jgi:hypothetical protein
VFPAVKKMSGFVISSGSDSLIDCRLDIRAGASLGSVYRGNAVEVLLAGIALTRSPGPSVQNLDAVSSDVRRCCCTGWGDLRRP